MSSHKIVPVTAHSAELGGIHPRQSNLSASNQSASNLSAANSTAHLNSNESDSQDKDVQDATARSSTPRVSRVVSSSATARSSTPRVSRVDRVVSSSVLAISPKGGFVVRSLSSTLHASNSQGKLGANLVAHQGSGLQRDSSLQRVPSLQRELSSHSLFKTGTGPVSSVSHQPGGRLTQLAWGQTRTQQSEAETSEFGKKTSCDDPESQSCKGSKGSKGIKKDVSQKEGLEIENQAVSDKSDELGPGGDTVETVTADEHKSNQIQKEK